MPNVLRGIDGPLVGFWNGKDWLGLGLWRGEAEKVIAGGYAHEREEKRWWQLPQGGKSEKDFFKGYLESFTV